MYLHVYVVIHVIADTSICMQAFESISICLQSHVYLHIHANTFIDQAQADLPIDLHLKGAVDVLVDASEMLVQMVMSMCLLM